jgi:hypothetical protein
LLADHASTPEESVEAALGSGARFLCLDGTLVPIDRVAARKADGRHLFYSGKHKTFGVKMHVIVDDRGNVI